MRQAGLAELRRDFGGHLLAPADAGYEEARRIWNGAVDRRPALIARCTRPADVISSIHFARTEQLLVAVRGGGHNVAGTAVCDDGLVIDLSPMKGISVDPARRTAHVQPGVLWGELDQQTQAFNLAVPGGIVTHTGVAGLTLGGGIGWLMRKYGLTCDNLLAADVVTADGELVRASERENPDLFWGIRGGGGNFGIVTSFQFKLHPVGPDLLAGFVLHAAENVHEVMDFYRAFALSAPDALTTIVNFRHAPSLPIISPQLHGAPVISIAACYAGSIADGEQALKALRAFGPPLVDLIRPGQYTAHQGLFDATVPHGLRYYWRSHYLPDLSSGAIEAIATHAWSAPSRQSFAIMFQMGGSVAHASDDTMAFAGRDAAYALNINSVWTAAAETPQHERWARNFSDAVRPFGTGGVYVNFVGDEGQERVRAAYGPQKYARLVALKNKYDPTNVFRLNQNIRPAAP